jgi:hypothetical protein
MNHKELEFFIPITKEFIADKEKSEVQFQKWKILGVIVEMFARDTHPKAKSFFVKLEKSYKRLTSNHKIQVIASNCDISGVFRFGFFGQYFGIEDYNFLDQVYTFSHDESFLEDLLESFDRLYEKVINDEITEIKFYKLPKSLKLKLKLLDNIKQSKDHFVENPLVAIILLCNLVSLSTVFVVSFVEFGFIGVLTSLLVFMMIGYWAFIQVDKHF